MKIVFTLCSNNYLAQAKTLGDSLLSYNADYSFFIGLVDKKVGQIDYGAIGHEVIEVEDIPIPNFEWMLTNYNIVEFNTAVKPFYMEYLIKEYNPDQLYYFDPDILVRNDFSGIENKFTGGDILLTPHVFAPVPKEVYPWENHYLNHGIFNLGFIGIKPTENSLNMIKWWQERCREHCKSDYRKGLYVDQLWANYIPYFFERVCIDDHPGNNVAFWNLHERKLAEKQGKFFVNDNYPLVFFHFSSFNPLNRERLYREGYSNFFIDNNDALLKLMNLYADSLLKNGYRDLTLISSFYNDPKSSESKKEILYKKILDEEDMFSDLRFRLIDKEKLLANSVSLIRKYILVNNILLQNNKNDDRYDDLLYALEIRPALLKKIADRRSERSGRIRAFLRSIKRFI